MMKKLLILLISIALLITLLSVTALGGSITPEAVSGSILALKEEYYEGRPWTNDNSYTWNGGIYRTGYGCAAFAFLLSDAAFGSMPARMITNISFDNIRAGDILCTGNESHWVIVTNKKADYVILAEGNYNSSIHWGRTMSRTQVEAADFYLTRYPAGADDPIALPDIQMMYMTGNVCENDTVYCTVEVTGEEMSFQWQYSADNGSTWNNCTGTGSNEISYSFTAAKEQDEWMYRCIVSNPAGSVISPAGMLRVLSLPEITVHPKDQSVLSGTKVTFRITATGDELCYQWQYSTDDGSNWNDCSSAGYDTDSFSITAKTELDNRLYRCVAFNNVGWMISGSARLTVEPLGSLSDAEITVSNRSYTGSALKPAPTVVLNGKTLVSGTDYTVSYSSNVNVGTAKVTVTGKGDYTGTATATFKVVAKALTADNVKATNRTYTGSAVNSTVTVTVNGTTLAKDTDYTVTFSNNVNAGTATATITGKGNYKGTVEKTYSILPKALTADNVKASNRTYTGSAVNSTVTVTVNGTTLAKGTDYTVTFSNNVNAGTATATITGKGNYKGTVEKTYSVLPASLAGASVTTPNRAYTGSALKPAPTVILNGKTLISCTDYTTSYSNNINLGTATVTVTGKGNYKGTASGTFRIVAKALSADNVKASNRTYTGKAVKSIVTVTVNGVKLTEGTDYTLAFSNNVNVGTAKVTVTGKGNYKGTATKEYQVLPINLSSATVTCSNRNYTGTPRTSAPTVVLNGKTLAEGTDYTVSYSNNVNAGTAKVTVTGTFKINKLNLNNADITASNRKYTGKPVKSSLKVVMNGVTLVEGTDYSTQYSNNVEVGTATVVITGIGNYTGSVTKNYQIKP